MGSSQLRIKREPQTGRRIFIRWIPNSLLYRGKNPFMPDLSSDLKFDLGHVLFIDIVGYSKLLINQQSEQIGQLKEIVRATEQFRLAEAEGKLLRLPTGDGGALVFRNHQEAPLLCAMEISHALKDHPELQVRMGIHSGPVNEITDLNEQANVAGAGINIAQRVMDYGDAGHILLSKRVADDLAPYPKWNPCLHKLGECEVKHGEKIGLVNFFTDEVGNPELPGKMKRSVQPEISAPAKSIAVLPFENLSEDKANAYFADGIQEEILTRLSKIADLKVISRTSTRRFKSVPDNLPEIARQLGVANILEGSVRKAGDQVRVHVQLIEASTDSHIWAERYDRKLTDIFAVESDVATRIADALQAQLSGPERRAISSRPTENSEAHQLYLRGRFYWNKWIGPTFDKSREYYEKAIELDPSYAPPYAGLADYYGFAFANGLLPPEEKWVKLEETCGAKALELDPSLGEAYNSLAAAKLYYHRDWPEAERDFRRGMELSPNFAEIHHHYAVCLILFRRDKEAFAAMRRALELDPLSARFGCGLGWLHFFTRDYDAAIDQYRRTIELDPNYALLHQWLGYACERKQMEEEAIAEWSKDFRLRGRDDDALLLETTFGKSGFDAALRALGQVSLERFKQICAQGGYVAAVEHVIAYMRLGDREQAFSWLEKAARERNRMAFQMRINPLFDPLRSDPRFEEITSQVAAP